MGREKVRELWGESASVAGGDTGLQLWWYDDGARVKFMDAVVESWERGDDAP